MITLHPTSSRSAFLYVPVLHRKKTSLGASYLIYEEDEAQLLVAKIAPALQYLEGIIQEGFLLADALKHEPELVP